MSDLTGKCVMIVDDNMNNLMLFSAILKANQATIISADCGEVCLEKIESGSMPDIILLDIQMPGLTGQETLDALLKIPDIKDKVPVVALTAHAMDGDEERMLADGFSGYLAKPVDTRKFPEQVGAFL